MIVKPQTVGVGTVRMIEECQALGAPTPIFEEYSGGLSVTFKFKEPMGVFTKPVKQKTELSERQKAILAIIKKHKAISLKQIIAELATPLSERIIQKDLSFLKQRGLVELKGRTHTAQWIFKP